MATLGVINEAAGTVQLLWSTYQDLKDRYEKFCDNPTLVEELNKIFTSLLNSVEFLANKCSSVDVNLREGYLEIYKSNIDKLNTFAGSVKGELEMELDKLSSLLHRATRAKRTNEWLMALKARASEAERNVLTIASCFSIKEDVAASSTSIKEHIAAWSISIKEEIATLSSSTEQPDKFLPSFDVPNNPGHVVLHFASNADMEGQTVRSDDFTPESRLKRAILRSGKLETVAALGSNRAQPCSVGATGMSGVGKSCALRGLATDEELRDRFGGGIYLVVLGKDATEEEVVRQLSQIVFQSGGHQCSKEVAAQMDINGAVLVAKKWFKGEQILLLVDDVWETSNAGRNIVARLSRVVDAECECRMVFTTRDLGVAMTGEAVPFAVRNAEESREILLEAVGMKNGEVEGFEGFMGVLGVCGGLPMALAVAGRAIKMRYQAGEVTWEEAWQEYRDEISKYRSIVDGSDAEYEYDNLSSAYKASLSMIEKHKWRALGFNCSMPVAETYRSLVVVQRQGCIPVHVLCALWKTADEIQAKRVIQVLVESSLAERKKVVVNEKAVAGIALHDLQLDFVQEECRKYREAEKWHRELVGSLLREAELESVKGVLGCGELLRPSSDEVGVFADEYVRSNVCRHLMCGGMIAELEILLLNPTWTLKKLCAGEFLSLDEDFRVLLEHVRKEEGAAVSDRRAKRGSKVWSLRMIVGAAKLSAQHVHENAREANFQMRARLADIAKESEMLKAFLSTMERCAERPWLRAVTPCLEEPGGALQAVAHYSRSVHEIRVTEDGESVHACGFESTKAFVFSVVGGQVEEEVWLNYEKTEEGQELSDEGSMIGYGVGDSSNIFMIGAGNDDSIEGVALGQGSIGASCEEKPEITCVCRSPNGKYAVTGHSDGRIRRWDAKSGALLGEMKRRHDNGVLCVAWSADGSRVASGGRDCTVRLWDAKTGEVVGDALKGHAGSVKSIALSADGSRVLSLGWNSIVRIWDSKTGKAFAYALETYGHLVSCVALSADGNRFATGGRRLDRTVRIWDAETGKAVADAKEGHWKWVSCVAWSADGSRVASGGQDGKVRIWDSGTGKAVGDALEGHQGAVTCVAWSADGIHIASAGKKGKFLHGELDREIRIWHPETNEAVGDALEGRGYRVWCVAWSTDGSRVASGGNDSTVRIWDAETGEAVGDALKGHSSVVSCVAWSADGSRVASGGWDGIVRIWDPEAGVAVGDEMKGHRTFGVSCIAWSPDSSRVASGGGDSCVCIWDAETGEAIGDPLYGCSDQVNCVAWSADGSHVAFGVENTVRIWDVGTGKAVGGALKGHGGKIECVAWSPDGSCVIAQDSYGSVTRCDVASMQRVEREDDDFTSRKMSVKGRTIRYVSEGDGTVLGTLRDEPYPYEFSEDGRKIALRLPNGRVGIMELVG